MFHSKHCTLRKRTCQNHIYLLLFFYVQILMNAQLASMLAKPKPAVQILRAHIHASVTRATRAMAEHVQVFFISLKYQC